MLIFSAQIGNGGLGARQHCALLSACSLFFQLAAVRQGNMTYMT